MTTAQLYAQQQAQYYAGLLESYKQFGPNFNVGFPLAWATTSYWESRYVEPVQLASQVIVSTANPTTIPIDYVSPIQLNAALTVDALQAQAEVQTAAGNLDAAAASLADAVAVQARSDSVPAYATSFNPSDYSSPIESSPPSSSPDPFAGGLRSNGFAIVEPSPSNGQSTPPTAMSAYVQPYDQAHVELTSDQIYGDTGLAAAATGGGWSLSGYLQQRPDLLNNWNNAHAAGASLTDPVVAAIRNFRSLEDYVFADAFTNSSQPYSAVVSAYVDAHPDIRNNWLRSVDPVNQGDPVAKTIAAYGSLGAYAQAALAANYGAPAASNQTSGSSAASGAGNPAAAGPAATPAAATQAAAPSSLGAVLTIAAALAGFLK